MLTSVVFAVGIVLSCAVVVAVVLAVRRVVVTVILTVRLLATAACGQEEDKASAEGAEGQVGVTHWTRPSWPLLG